MKTCGIYCRVSGPGQSIVKQKKKLPPYAKERGWEVFDTYEDDGISGSTIAKRPGFQKLLRDIEKGCFSVLVVEDITRITRADSAEERGRILDLLIKHRITIAAPADKNRDEEEINPRKTRDEKYLNDLLYQSKQERRLIAKRLAGGRASAMEAGVPMFRGSVYGRRFWVKKPTNVEARKDPANWTVHWEVTDHDLVDRIRRAGELMIEKKWGYRRAAEVAGIPWFKLRKCLMNSAGSVFTQKNACKAIGIEETYEFPIPEECRIFDDTTLAKIRRVIRTNSSKSGKTGRPKKYTDFLLSTMVMNDNGYKLEPNKKRRSQKGKGHTNYYFNRGQIQRPKQPNWHIRADLLEPAVVRAVAHVLSSSALFEKAVYGDKGDADYRAELQKDVKRLTGDLDRLYRRRNNIVDKIGDGLLSDDEIKEKMGDIREQETKLKALIAERQDQVNNIPSPALLEARRQEIVHKYGPRVPVPDLTREAEEQRCKRHILDLPWKEKRDLLLRLLSGKDSANRKYGVYVNRVSKGKFQFELYATIGIVCIGETDKPDLVVQPSEKYYYNKKYGHPSPDQGRRQACGAC